MALFSIIIIYFIITSKRIKRNADHNKKKSEKQLIELLSLPSSQSSDHHHEPLLVNNTHVEISEENYLNEIQFSRLEAHQNGQTNKFQTDLIESIENELTDLKNKLLELILILEKNV